MLYLNNTGYSKSGFLSTKNLFVEKTAFRKRGKMDFGEYMRLALTAEEVMSSFIFRKT